jgi:hypothetical protein
LISQPGSPMFGGGVLGDNDPDHHEKIVKFNELLANCAIYSSTLDLTQAANALTADGWHIDPDDLATVTPLHHHRHPPLRRLGAQPHPARRDRRRAPGPRRGRLSPLVQQEPSGPGGGGMAERRASRSFPAGHPRPRRSAGCQGSAQPAAMRHFR